jgi:AcrR family transcriptional regulator
MSPIRKPLKAKEKGKARRSPRAYLPAAERRSSIIAAAQAVFARSNLKGARTRDIAKEAQVNPATIFEHFESKEALFHAAVVQPLLDAFRGVDEKVKVYETAATPDELARLAGESAERHVSDMIEVFPLLVAALFSEPDLGRDLYRKHIAPHIRLRGKVLEPLAREGMDIDFIGLGIFGTLFAIALDRHFGGATPAVKQADLPHLVNQFARMATGGFARVKGRPGTAARSESGKG